MSRYPKWNVGRQEWGPCAWRWLHTLSFLYADNPTAEEQRVMREYLYAFQKVLPCDNCRNHFAELMQRHPPQLESRDAFMEWVVKAHNQVNERTGKRSYTMEEVVALYQGQTIPTWMWALLGVGTAWVAYRYLTD